jgi:outer membrane immunogenic protein
MKKLLLASAVAVAVALCAPAIAADMPVKGPVYKAAPAMFSWTGCYSGIEAGWSWAKSRIRFPDGDPAGDYNADGGLVGVTLGCNWQNGNWVWGVETDLAWSGLKGQGGENANPGVFLGTKSNWLNTDRVRVGYAADRSLWFLTGGIAVRDIEATNFGLGFFDKLSHTSVGWTAGFGGEFALADPHWSWKIEYLYADYGTHSYAFTDFSTKGFAVHENIVRIGINWRGDWGKGPVSAKY